jgi:hypothetical protein
MDTKSKGGIMTNIWITGKVVAREIIHDHDFDIVLVARRSGVTDYIRVKPPLSQLEIGTRYSIYGTLKTKCYNRNADPRYIWFVDAKSAEFAQDSEPDLNRVEANLELMKRHDIRTTSLKAVEVVDVSLNCPDNKCYLWAVAYGSNAVSLSKVELGQNIDITGKLQNRHYMKNGEEKHVWEILIRKYSVQEG